MKSGKRNNNTLYAGKHSQFAARHSCFLKLLVKSLDLLSINLKTYPNKLVFFAPSFARYEEIYNRYYDVTAFSNSSFRSGNNGFDYQQ